MDPDVKPVAPEDAAAFIASRKGRNRAILVALLAFAGLFYAIAMVKMVKG